MPTAPHPCKKYIGTLTCGRGIKCTDVGQHAAPWLEETSSALLGNEVLLPMTMCTVPQVVSMRSFRMSASLSAS